MTNNKKPYRQEMIDAIYEKIARKDLTFGCRLKMEGDDYIEIYREEGVLGEFFIGVYRQSWRLNKINKIIGHPVMIGDLMDYFDFHIFDHGSYGYEVKTDFYHINGVWKNKRKPIEEQSSDCIEYIYNLIK